VKSDVETLSPTRVKLTIEVPFDELKPSLDAAYGRIAQNVNIPGFRKGKVPARIIEQRFGRSAVLEEAVEDAVLKSYEQAIRETKLFPLNRPDINVTALEDGATLSFTAEVDVRPEFDLPDFSSVTVTLSDVEPSIDEIAQQVEALRARFATLKEVDRASTTGDVLLVDIAGATDDGDAVEDLTGKALSYELGTNGMLPGFDEAVTGSTKGDTVVLDFTPQNGDWAGINLKASVKVSAVRERVLPPLDDTFAQLASEFDTVSELQDDIRIQIRQLKEQGQINEAKNQVLEYFGTLDLPLPEDLISAQVEAHFEDGHEGDDGHRAEVEAGARREMTSQFVLDKVADEEGFGVDETDLGGWLTESAPRYGMTPDQLAHAIVEANQLPMAYLDIKRAKALSHVLMQVTLVNASGADVELAGLQA